MAVVAVGVIYAGKQWKKVKVQRAKTQYNPDPYGRAEQKKQGREVKNKARKKIIIHRGIIDVIRNLQSLKHIIRQEKGMQNINKEKEK